MTDAIYRLAEYYVTWVILALLFGPAIACAVLAVYVVTWPFRIAVARIRARRLKRAVVSFLRAVPDPDPVAAPACESCSTEHEMLLEGLAIRSIGHTCGRGGRPAA